MTINNRKKIAVIDYGMGNLRSVKKTMEFFNVDTTISNRKEDIVAADRIIMPGVGAFPDAMKNLQELDLVETLNKEVINKGKPFLGICLGMQLLARESFEVRRTSGLGWIDAVVKEFDRSKNIKIPHIGWNNIRYSNACPLFKGLPKEPTFYFVHSHNVHCGVTDLVTASCEYGQVFSAAVQKDNIFGTQFHPEKSQTNGLMVIANFLNWRE